MAKAIKIETEEQRILRKAREEKEIRRWEKEKAKPKLKGYMAFFVLIITVVYIVDEVTTQIGTQMQDVLTQALGDALGSVDKAASTIALIGTISVVSGAASFFYRPLSDRFGRKIFLIINTLGMGLGMFLVGMTTGIPTYLIGVLVTSFFTPHDMQVIYIQECCPKEKRGTYYTVIKSIATLAMLLIPILRNVFLPNGFNGNWKYVFLLPSSIALVVSIAAIFLMRETDPFIENRLHYLGMSDEEREQAKKEQKAVAQKEGVFEGFKYIFKNKSLLWICLASALIWMGMGISNYYNAIMKYGYSGLRTIEDVLAYKSQVLNDSGYTMLDQILDGVTEPITQSLYTFAIGSAIAQLIPGFIADKYGRRQAAIFSSAFAAIAFILFWIGAYSEWSPYVVGLFSGAAVGAFWLAGDMMQFLMTESAPTSVRVSVTNAYGLFYYPGIALGILIPMVVGLIATDLALPIATLITSGIGMVLGSIIMMVKVKDTKGVDMNTVGEKE